MATDKLTQLGKRIGQFQEESDLTSRYVSKNLPLIEESTDNLGALYTYVLEFKMYRGGSAKLNITIFQNFKPL